jgi:hypothetical protein
MNILLNTTVQGIFRSTDSVQKYSDASYFPSIYHTYVVDTKIFKSGMKL